MDWLSGRLARQPSFLCCYLNQQLQSHFVSLLELLLWFAFNKIYYLRVTSYNLDHVLSIFFMAYLTVGVGNMTVYTKRHYKLVNQRLFYTT